MTIKSMSLNEFIGSKPKELRLGQWFVLNYWKGTDELSQALFQKDGEQAIEMIRLIMEAFQWNVLPEINDSEEDEKNKDN